MYSYQPVEKDKHLDEQLELQMQLTRDTEGIDTFEQNSAKVQSDTWK